jgi:hypothetical protein
MPNKAQPRDHLRATIAKREKRRERVEQAVTALERGEALLHEAEARLAKLSDVEKTIASHHAATVKTWAGSGGEKPCLDVPKTLIARRMAREETVKEVNAAKAACQALSDDLEAAKAALAEAERVASEVAVPVMMEEAERVATYLDAARREVWRLESQLRGLGELWLPTGKDQAPRPVRLPLPTLAALSAQEPQYPPAMRPEIKQAAAWRSFHTALLTEPTTRWQEDEA